MRHRKRGRKFNKSGSERNSMSKNLVNALLSHERIVTTKPRAKEYRKLAERMITYARRAHAATEEARGGDAAAKAHADGVRLKYVRLAIAKIGKKKLYDRDGDPVLTPTNRIKTVIQKLFDDLGPRFAARPGGYTRIVPLPKPRQGDAAPKVIWELVQDEAVSEPEPAAKKKRGKKGGKKKKKAKGEEADE